MELRSHRNNFSLLPPHIITQILGYLQLKDLKTASSVCKTWHYASNHPQIFKTLILQPKESDFKKKWFCKSNRKYGVLKLVNLKFDKMDCHYFKLFEKFCPFINELIIDDSNLEIHQFLKLLELSTRLESLSIYCMDYSNLAVLSSLFPLNYDRNAKNQIFKNLSTIKNMTFNCFDNNCFIKHLVRCAINLEKLGIFNEYEDYKSNTYMELCEIFDRRNAGNLRHLTLNVDFNRSINNFIRYFVKTKDLNLKSFLIGINWNWRGGVYDSSLFRQFILKLKSLEEFKIYEVEYDQLSFICRHLVNLKSLDCEVDGDQPISELGNLKQLRKLSCSNENYYNHANSDEIDQFFNCKFEYLRIFKFGEFVTEPNLMKLCQNHPNLIELKLTKLLTPNLEIIFKYLTELRILEIRFWFEELNQVKRAELFQSWLISTARGYHFKISRLHNLEVLIIGNGELVNEYFCEDDVRALTKLRKTNLPIFRK